MSRFHVTLLNEYGVDHKDHDKIIGITKKLSIPDSHFEFYLKSFKFFDREPQDNTIEKEELINAMRCFGLNPRPQEVKELLTQYDHDGKNSNQKGSGKLDLSEFIELTKAALDKHDPGAIQKAFDSFDLNNDGYISADELRKAMTQHGDKMTDDEVDEMLKDLDIDKDNKVNVQEFITLLKSCDHI